MSISRTQMIALINRALRNAKGCILEEGSFFPTLLMYRKGGYIDVEETIDDNIALVTSDRNYTGAVAAEYFAEDGVEVHLSQVLFHRRSDEQEEAIEEISKRMIRKYKPDICGFIFKCAYREHLSSAGPAEPIESDPDAMDLLYAAVSDPVMEKPLEIFIPFVNKGELPIHLQKPAIADEPAVRYDAQFIDSAWSVGGEGIPDICPVLFEKPEIDTGKNNLGQRRR